MPIDWIAYSRNLVTLASPGMWLVSNAGGQARPLGSGWLRELLTLFNNLRHLWPAAVFRQTVVAIGGRSRLADLWYGDISCKPKVFLRLVFEKK